jgi:hypothetical protein
MNSQNHERTKQMRYKHAPRLLALTLAVVAIAGLLAACGSSSSTSSSSSSSSSAAASTSGSGSGGSASRTAARAKLTTCLKQHGVTLPSRPAGSKPPSGSGGGYGGGGGGHFFGGGGAGGAGGRFKANPKLAAAFKACGGAAGFRGRAGGFHISHTAITKFVSCVKQHGFTLPKPNFSGKGSVFPASIEKNAKFQAASKACRADLMPAGGPAGASSSSSSSG